MEPVIILVNPQLGENIGTSARAMMNGGLTELRIVNPKLGWPNVHATKPAAGAVSVLENVQVFTSVQDAVADLNLVLATTARARYMNKSTYNPPEAAEVMWKSYNAGHKIGILFGPERTGLHNDDLTVADSLITIPLNPDYTSLNLAQAVLLMAYEWFKLKNSADYAEKANNEEGRACKKELVGLFDQLEFELDRSGFLRIEHKRATMIRNLRNIFLRANLTEQEVRTLRGVISDLVTPYFADRTGLEHKPK